MSTSCIGIGRSSLAVVCLLASLGCDGPASDEVASVEAPLEQSPPPVPVIRGPTRCDGEAPEAPDLCSWLQSTDAVVWARVLAVEFAYDLLIDRGIGGSGWNWVERCPDVTSPGLKLGVEVVHGFHGDVSGTLEVRLGRDHLMMLDPSPEVGPDGGVRWVAHPDARGGAPLEPGQLVGLALYRLEHRGEPLWSPLYEPMFGLSDVGRVRAGVSARPWPEPFPTGLEGRTLAEASAALAECATLPASTAAVERNEARRAWLYDEGRRLPTRYAAGECFMTNHEVPTCQRDADCPPIMPVCVFGVCAIQ
jgi:hypothetical protein